MAKGRKTGGRQKGIPNMVTGVLKDAILQAAALSGGEATDGNPGGLVGYLKRIADDNVAVMGGLLGRVLPLQVTGDADNPLRTIHEVRETIVDPRPE